MLRNMLRCPELVKTHVKKLVKKHVKIANVGGNHLFCKVFEFPGEFKKHVKILEVFSCGKTC